jgi:chromosome segregation ATPase
VKSYIRGILEGILERILEHMAYTTKREQALALELAQVKDQLGGITARAEAETTRADDAMTLADERLALLTAAATRAESIEKQLGLERTKRDLAANHTVRLELRVQALKRRRERLQAELGKFQNQLARADVSGRIRELQEEKAQLQQRLADLQTYFILRIEPFTEEKQGSANSR